MDHLKVLGHVELTAEGMNLVNEKTSGPFRIVEVDHAWGVGILDSRDILHWVMKGNYTILDMNSIRLPETAQSNIDRIIQKMGGQCKVSKVKRTIGQDGQVHNVHIDDKLDHILLSLTNEERIILAKKLNDLTE